MNGESMSSESQDGISRRYLTFADQEAHGRSPLYESFARSVTADPAVLAFLTKLPPPKRQPNLFFAAVRHLFGTPTDWSEFRQLVLQHPDDVTQLMLARSTQTNEPARCATLLPVLAGLPQPIALLEVGASAGLCLLPDFYAYTYNDTHKVLPSPASTETPNFFCRASPSTPLPNTMPHVVWRAGLDLNPIDIHDPEQADWLETLVWPEQEGRLSRLRNALAVARQHTPRVVRGNLLTDLQSLAGEAPEDATLVIFHTAVLAYVDRQEDRDRFARTVRDRNAVWISNESPMVFPDIAGKVGTPRPNGQFLLAQGENPVAWTDPHGATLSWLAY